MENNMELSIWAIALSIVIGVITNIMTPHVSNLFGRISSSIKVGNEKRKVVFTNTVQYLLNNPHEELVFRIEYALSILFIGLVLLFAVFLMLSTNIVAVIVGFLVSLYVYYGLFKINNRRRIREELIKIKKTEHPDINLG
jgi:hypothetical protein